MNRREVVTVSPEARLDEAAVLLTQLGHSPGWLDLLYFVDLKKEVAERRR